MLKMLFKLVLVISMAAFAQANTWNVQLSTTSIGLESALNEKVSVTGYVVGSFSTLKYFGGFAKANYYFSGVYEDSLYVGAYGGYYNVSSGSVDYNGTSYDYTGDVVKIGALVGYRWIWENFNINIDVGYGYAGGTGFEKQVTYTKAVYSAIPSISEESVRTIVSFFSTIHIGWAF